MSGKVRDLTGQVFGRLTVNSLAEIRKTKQGSDSYWNVTCACGKLTIVKRGSLTTGNTVSCGCYRVDRLKGINRKPLGVSAFNDILHVYKKRADKRGLTFELTNEQVEVIVKQECHYCGIEAKQVSAGYKENGNFIYNGIDRVDSSKGYQMDNVVPCCGVCNRAKHTMSYDDFIEYLRRVAARYQ